jgi:effector-binding domain-containing protein
MKNTLLAGIVLAGMLTSCGGSGEQKQSVDSTQAATPAVDSAAAKEPTFTIEETTTKEQFLMVMSDSAQSTTELGEKLGKIFASIGECAGKCKMESAGPPVAWYNGPSAPWKFEAGMPYTTECGHPEKGISVKTLKAGKAVVAHYFGPYEMSDRAYQACEKYIAEHKLTIDGPPYEVYIGDPGTEPDMYKVQTDVVFPIK